MVSDEQPRVPVAQRMRAIRLLVLADDEQYEHVVDRIGLALCPDENHAGPCETPWTITGAPLDEIEDPSGWQGMAEQLIAERAAEP